MPGVWTHGGYYVPGLGTLSQSAVSYIEELEGEDVESLTKDQIASALQFIYGSD